jgi:hypothetical protein|tara:strand:- start:128 stop:295 length:168 start_codon:yes stop_codon:yes gene_type:complete
MIKKFRVDYKSSITVIARSIDEAKKSAESSVAMIHPKFNMKFDSMTLVETLGEEE